MPHTDQYNEVLIAIIAGIIIFFVTGGMIVFILLFFQRKKFQHRQMINDMEKKFSEEILKAQLEIQEETFNHISQEIHDNVGQILSLAKVQINIMTESDNMDRGMLNDVKWNIGKAMVDLRDVAKSLSSERMKTIPILQAMQDEADRINKSGIVEIILQVEGEEKKMDEAKKLILFRIIQESIQNIIKHADATAVRVAFHYTADMLLVQIQDDGKGFVVEEALAGNSGLGLSNMKSRTALAGGSCRIDSIPNTGTTIIINMPYE